MMKTLLSGPKSSRWLLTWALALLGWATAQAQTPIIATIGTGTSATSTNALLSTSTTTNKYARTISIFSAAELTAAGAVAGSIVSIAWFKGGAGEYPTADAQLSIYMKSTTASMLAVNPVDWASEVTGATTVYSNNALALPTGTGFKTFTLTTPFAWNGTSNVEVLVDWFRNSTPTADITWQYTAVGTTGMHATQVNSVAIPTVRFAANRPNTQFGISTTTPPACSPATALAVGSITATSASLGFTASGSATSYTVTYTAQGGALQTLTPNPTAPPVALSGLTPGTQYTVSVVSNCAGGATSAAASTTFITAVAPVTCSPPTGLSFLSTSATTGTVSFTPAAGAPAGTTYLLTYSTAGGPSQTVAPNPSASPVTLTGLMPGATYTLTIRAVCSPTLSSTTVGTVTFSIPLASRESRTAAQIALYPSPAHQAFTVRVPAELSNRAVPATLINALGQVVSTSMLAATGTGAEGQFDVSQLSAGIYTLRLELATATISKRVVVE